jgi:hypothetical protein
MTQVDGVQTVSDVKDLLAARDYAHAQLDKAYADFAPLWASKDGVTFAAWTNDWTAQSQRYQTARSKASTMIAVSNLDPEPAWLIPAQGTYDAILTAEKASWPSANVVSPGDFDDLNVRLSNAATQWGGQLPQYPNMPQPVAPDPGSWLLKNLPDFSKATDPKQWPWWAVPALVVTGGLFVASKVKEILT